MSESGNTENANRPRWSWEKVCDRMDARFGWLRKRGWLETEAEVIECVSAESCTIYSGCEGPIPSYVVTFTYVVDGVEYKGMTISPVEVELQSRMTIRYNPRHPAQNNSFDSETEWIKPVAKLEEVLALGLALLAVVVYFFVRR